MASGLAGDGPRQMRRLWAAGPAGGLTDAQLLERFAARRDGAAEVAFEALVVRHGPMVFRVCRALLRDERDAEDAFQATFLVLARKAGRVGAGGPLGPWLHGVARRVSLKARSASARRARREGGAILADPPASGSTSPCPDLAPTVHEELGRLPEKYRRPVVLCHLEGLTHAEAARELGWPVGTVSVRLARARDLLRHRLARRGFAPDASASALVPALLAGATPPAETLIRLASAALPSRVGMATAGALAHAKGTHMIGINLAKWLAVPLLLGVGAVGALRPSPNDPAPNKPKAAPPAQAPAAPVADDPALLAQGANHLRQIGLALHKYQDARGAFPAAAITDAAGKPLLSWRVAILPFLGHEALYREFRLDEPWDSAHNKALLTRMPAVYASPVRHPIPGNQGDTHVLASVGPHAALDDRPVKLSEFTDGMGNTILATDTMHRSPWTKPEDRSSELYLLDLRPGISQPGGFNALFADGAVRFIKRSTSVPTLKALLSRDGGEAVDPDNL
ncbi:sigma-70 family RNA polymerase sigma factor [Tundrisphaera sp. TA3]|uniref:sigma-70 family RNA polymerase sigma factor n=1 Tax=Tundrisphaera sp. TA3 TaxID=3435775 RepID=UPI003EBDEF49